MTGEQQTALLQDRLDLDVARQRAMLLRRIEGHRSAITRARTPKSEARHRRALDRALSMLAALDLLGGIEVRHG